MDIDAEAWEEWTRIFAGEVPPKRTRATTAQDIDTLVNLIYAAFNMACIATMKKKGSAPAFSVRWWTDDCAEAAQALQVVATDEELRACNLTLKRVVRRAKREWADRYITTANIWEVAAWRHGRRSSHIPALRNEDGTLTFDHEEMSGILASRFFAEDCGLIPEHFPDDPPPHPPCPFPPSSDSRSWPALPTAAAAM